MAKKNIGTLAAILSLDPRRWRKTMKAISSELEGFKRIGSGIAAGIRPVMTALSVGVAGAAAATTVAVKAQFENVDAAAKVADRLGLATEAYAAYSYAADLAGVGNDEFASSLTRMNRLVGQAISGNAAAAKVLEGLDLAPQALRGLSVEDRFLAIADAIREIPDPSARVAAAMQVFGKSGAAMINVVQGGSMALEQARKEADALGITFSRIDAAKLEVANDAITTLKYAIGGLARQLAVVVAPVILAIARNLTALASDGTAGMQVLGNASMYIARGLNVVGKAVDYITIGFQSVKLVAMEVVSTMYSMVAGGLKLAGWAAMISTLVTTGNVAAAKATEAAFDKLSAEQIEYADEFERRSARAQAALTKAMAADTGSMFTTEYAKALRDMERISAEIAEAAKQQQKLTDAAMNYTDALNDAPEPATRPTDTRGPQLQTLDAIVAGSAQAQRLAFEAANPVERNTLDKQQLAEARRHTRILERIDRSLAEDDAVADF